MVITLPWPPKGLHPNDRMHFMAVSRIKKSYREACFWEAMSQGIKGNAPYRGPFKVHLTFVPPNRRSRDEDGMVASLKSGLDGLAQAMGVDDKDFRLTHELDRENIGGFVKVAIEGTT